MQGRSVEVDRDLKLDARLAVEVTRGGGEAFVEATGNSQLVDLFDAVWSRARTVQAYSRYFQRELVHLPIRDVHQDLLDALAADPERAAAAMLQHIREGRDAAL